MGHIWLFQSNLGVKITKFREQNKQFIHDAHFNSCKNFKELILIPCCVCVCLLASVVTTVRVCVCVCRGPGSNPQFHTQTHTELEYWQQACSVSAQRWNLPQQMYD